MDSSVIPDSFEQVTRSGFANHIGPYYVARLDEPEGQRLWIGLTVDERHGGGPGRGHGGVLLWMLDEIMGSAVSEARDGMCVTVSMQTQFLQGYHIGDFLRATADVTRTGKRLQYVNGRILSGDRLVATGTGVWMSTGHPIPRGAARKAPD